MSHGRVRSHDVGQQGAGGVVALLSLKVFVFADFVPIFGTAPTREDRLSRCNKSIVGLAEVECVLLGDLRYDDKDSRRKGYL